MNIKSQTVIKKKLAESLSKKKYLKEHMTDYNRLKLDERIKVLKWILSDLDDKLPDLYL